MFMINFLFQLPLWLLAIVLAAFFMGFAMICLWSMRRWVLPQLKLRYEDAYYAAVMAQCAMLLYGLIAALTAVSVWQRYAQVSDIVSSEATAIASLWRGLGAYPQPLRDMARDTLRGYTVQVIDEAWPQQQKGETPVTGVAWMDQLQSQLLAFEPNTDGQRIAHAEILRSFNSLIQHRRQRVDSVQGGLPGVLWFVLFPGAMGCILLCMFFHVENTRFQAAMLLGVSMSLSMVIFVIVALDRPFIGDAAIKADSYHLVYEHHMRLPGQ